MKTNNNIEISSIIIEDIRLLLNIENNINIYIFNWRKTRYNISLAIMENKTT